MIILDTNVLSEIMRVNPAPPVAEWVVGQIRSELFTTAITEAEIFFGIQLLPLGKRRDSLLLAAEAILADDFAGRILPFDSAAAHAYSIIATQRRASGRPISDLDAQIAAIARTQKAALSTRNVSDFENCGIELIDPWQAER